MKKLFHQLLKKLLKPKQPILKDERIRFVGNWPPLKEYRHYMNNLPEPHKPNEEYVDIIFYGDRLEINGKEVHAPYRVVTPPWSGPHPSIDTKI